MNETKYDFKIEMIPEQTVASVRYIGRYDEMGQHIGKLFKAVGGSAVGPVFALYYDHSHKDDDADIEVCVAVKKTVDKNGVTTRTLPAQKCLVTTHVGPYDTLNRAYKAMIDEFQDRDIAHITPTREVYVKGPGMLLKGNPNKYQTTIQFPVESDEA